MFAAAQWAITGDAFTAFNAWRLVTPRNFGHANVRCPSCATSSIAIVTGIPGVWRS